MYMSSGGPGGGTPLTTMMSSLMFLLRIARSKSAVAPRLGRDINAHVWVSGSAYIPEAGRCARQTCPRYPGHGAISLIPRPHPTLGAWVRGYGTMCMLVFLEESQGWEHPTEVELETRLHPCTIYCPRLAIPSELL